MADTDTDRLEFFTEMFNAATGYNLQHYHVPQVDARGHLTGDDCPCSPVRVPHEPPASA